MNKTVKSSFLPLAALFVSLVSVVPLRAEIISAIGIKGGLNFANVEFPLPAEPWNSRTGLSAGGFITFRINDLLSIQAEVLISEKGAVSESLSKGTSVTITADLTYLDIPILWKFYLPSLSKSAVRPNLYWGPCWSTKLIGTRSTKTGEQVQEDKIQDLNDTDFSLLFGGGVDFDVQTGKVFLDIRFGKSYSKIFKTDKNKNKVVSLLVGYSFN